MGKITSLIEFNGSVGNLVGYRGRDGRNVVRFKVHNPRNPKTTLQMRRRVSWANLVSLWSAITPYMHPSFNRKPQGQTDFNAYMADNVDISPVYLTKKQARANYVIAAPVRITDGDLAPISVTLVSGGKASSDIDLTGLEYTAETTIGMFSHYVLQNNPQFKAGDQITGIFVKQVSVGSDNTPKVEVIAQRIVLDESNYDTMQETLEYETGSANAMFDVVNNKLASGVQIQGMCAWIHSRVEDGETKVSTQALVGSNNILSTYTSAAAQLSAMQSYGVNEKYLSPVGNKYSASQDNQEP